jgi:hypothetical protein
MWNMDVQVYPVLVSKQHQSKALVAQAESGAMDPYNLYFVSSAQSSEASSANTYVMPQARPTQWDKWFFAKKKKNEDK